MLDLYTPQTIGASTGLHDSPQLLSVKRATSPALVFGETGYLSALILR